MVKKLLYIPMRTRNNNKRGVGSPGKGHQSLEVLSNLDGGEDVLSGAELYGSLRHAKDSAGEFILGKGKATCLVHLE